MIKKDIMGFLMPDWRKILVTFIIFMTFPFSAQITICGMRGCSTYDVVMLVGMSFFNKVTQTGLLFTDFIILLAFLVFFYFLSCVLVLFYEKISEYIMEEFVK